MKKEIYNVTHQEIPTAILVSIIIPRQTVDEVDDYLKELAFLAETLGIQTKKKFIQQLDKIHPKTFVGKGKLEELLAFVEKEEIDIIIFDDDLTTVQIRNIEAMFEKCTVLDRSLLILQIFAKHARTAQAKTQVELAQYEYMLPRLTHLWTHHSRQKGGIGMRGPGETELETDRRLIQNRITTLKKKLGKIDTQHEIRSKNRKDMFRVSLVGYTNVGKSTIMRLLTKADVLVENKLFATLDLTARKWYLNEIPIILNDTIGFIRKLPTTLIESFKTTLAEVIDADLLLHVVDISNPYFEKQINFVGEVLKQINAQNKPTILVFNKIDQYQTLDLPPFEPKFKPNSVEEWEKSYIAKSQKSIFISATQKQNISDFREIIYKTIKSLQVFGKMA